METTVRLGEHLGNAAQADRSCKSIYQPCRAEQGLRNDFCDQEKGVGKGTRIDPHRVRRLTDQLISLRFGVACAVCSPDPNFTFTSMKDSGAAPLTSFLTPFRCWLCLGTLPGSLNRMKFTTPPSARGLLWCVCSLSEGQATDMCLVWTYVIVLCHVL